MSNRTPTLAIADDHEALRNRLETLLSEWFEVVASVGDGDALLDAVEELHPQVLLVDLQMPGKGGFAVLQELALRGDDTPVVVLSTTEDSDVVIRALDLGARGYVFKSRIASDLTEALESALRGACFVSCSKNEEGRPIR